MGAPYKKMKVGETQTINCGHWAGKMRAIINYAYKSGKFFEMSQGKTHKKLKVKRIK